MVIILLSSDRNKKKLKQLRNSIHVALPYSTNSPLAISKYAMKDVSSMFKNGIKYKRADIIVTGLVPNDNHQLILIKHQNHDTLMNTIESLNIKMGDYKIKLENQDLERTWKCIKYIYLLNILLILMR